MAKQLRICIKKWRPSLLTPKKRQKTNNTGITVEKYTIAPGYFGPYSNASISLVLPPGSNTFEWHKSRRRVHTAVDNVLIEDLQKMQCKIIRLNFFLNKQSKHFKDLKPLDCWTIV